MTRLEDKPTASGRGELHESGNDVQVARDHASNRGKDLDREHEGDEVAEAADGGAAHRQYNAPSSCPVRLLCLLAHVPTPVLTSPP